MKRSKNITYIYVDKNSAIPQRVSDEQLKEAKVHYGYDWVNREELYDEYGEETGEVLEEYISRNKAVQETIDDCSSMYYLRKDKDIWIVDEYTHKVLAVIAIDITIKLKYEAIQNNRQ